ncbi:bifunctional inositol-1 monophosphatase/fructose-1,6-bisphosphatase [Methanocaldococcus villosus KIN24-T80]|uniref:fructose-bisphosphatase n=1 Tax=Methanocaldococcus villosus KIN24-T80 TaxID=1069083 RepID=N6VPC6_9EURY|nr:bifunctional inositol-1 monophosphatase/fructose-1,6-bisphosphatase [Methanocaldococcus villosus KIN24-T80]
MGKKIIKEVEKEVMPYYGKRGKVIDKNIYGDETSIFDKISEDIALKYLNDVNIISEEIGKIDNGSEWTVVIDPIDGSFNFKIGIPFFAFCFAVFKNDKPYYGLTYDFINKHIYEAYTGKGAYLNNKRIKIKEFDPNNISVCIYAENININAKRVRMLGAFGLEMCLVARGAIDACLDLRPKVRLVDIASSYIICKEAGAIIVNKKKETLNLELDHKKRYDIIVANSKDFLKLI